MKGKRPPKPKPGKYSLPLAEFEHIYGRAQTVNRYLNGVVSFVIEDNGSYRFLECTGSGEKHPVEEHPLSDFVKYNGGMRSS